MQTRFSISYLLNDQVELIVLPLCCIYVCSCSTGQQRFPSKRNGKQDGGVTKYVVKSRHPSAQQNLHGLAMKLSEIQTVLFKLRAVLIPHQTDYRKRGEKGLERIRL